MTVRASKNYLAVIRQREYSLWATGVPATELHAQGLQLPSKPPPEGLRLLHQFCETGVRPRDTQGIDLFTRELFYYRLLDIHAQIYKKGTEDTTKGKLMVRTIDKLVHHDNSETRSHTNCHSFRMLASTTGQILYIKSQWYWTSSPPCNLSHRARGPQIHSFCVVFKIFALRPRAFTRAIFFIMLPRPAFICAIF